MGTVARHRWSGQVGADTIRWTQRLLRLAESPGYESRQAAPGSAHRVILALPRHRSLGAGSYAKGIQGGVTMQVELGKVGASIMLAASQFWKDLGACLPRKQALGGRLGALGQRWVPRKMKG